MEGGVVRIEGCVVKKCKSVVKTFKTVVKNKQFIELTRKKSRQELPPAGEQNLKWIHGRPPEGPGLGGRTASQDSSGEASKNSNGTNSCKV